jgi:hypothetical protein
MSVFGNLADMSLTDLLPVLGRSAGVFRVCKGTGERRYYLHLRDGLLTAMLVDELSVSDLFEVRNHMVEISSLSHGEFEFQKKDTASLRSDFGLSLEMLTLLSVAAVQELDTFRPQFPSPKTVFQMSRSRDIWLKSDLQEFWDVSSLLLSKGANAEQISRSTGIFLDQCLFSLYQLRAIGMIVPMRAFQTEQTPQVVSDAPNKDTVHFPIIGSPFRFKPQTEEPEIIVNTSLFTREPEGDLSRISAQRVDLSLVKKMLNSIQLMFNTINL